MESTQKAYITQKHKNYSKVDSEAYSRTLPKLTAISQKVSILEYYFHSLKFTRYLIQLKTIILQLTLRDRLIDCQPAKYLTPSPL